MMTDMSRFNHACLDCSRLHQPGVPYRYSTMHTSTHQTRYDTAYYDAAAACSLTVPDAVFNTYKKLAKTVHGASACLFLIKCRKKTDGTVQLRDVVFQHNHVRVLVPCHRALVKRHARY